MVRFCFFGIRSELGLAKPPLRVFDLVLPKPNPDLIPKPRNTAHLYLEGTNPHEAEQAVRVFKKLNPQSQKKFLKNFVNV